MNLILLKYLSMIQSWQNLLPKIFVIFMLVVYRIARYMIVRLSSNVSVPSVTVVPTAQIKDSQSPKRFAITLPLSSDLLRYVRIITVFSSSMTHDLPRVYQTFSLRVGALVVSISNSSHPPLLRTLRNTLIVLVVYLEFIKTPHYVRSASRLDECLSDYVRCRTRQLKNFSVRHLVLCLLRARPVAISPMFRYGGHLRIDFTRSYLAIVRSLLNYDMNYLERLPDSLRTRFSHSALT